MNWQNLDLNLLRVLDAMLGELNTTRVGARIGLSQPAVSSALSRLRHALGDPLFVREGNRMTTTPFAEAIRAPLRESLERIERTLAGRSFDPAISTRIFRILGDDNFAEMVLPPLAALLAAKAPGVVVQLLPSNPRPFADQLADGGIDLAFWIPQETPEWIEAAFAYHASGVVVAARGNPGLREAGVRDGGSLPLDLYCELPHVIFAPGGALDSREDEALAAIGRSRRVAFTVPDFFTACRVAGQSAMLGNVPTQFALSLAGQLGLAVFPYPMPVRHERLFLYWHRRHSADPEHRWLRERVLDLLRPLDAIAFPTPFDTPPPAPRQRRKARA